MDASRRGGNHMRDGATGVVSGVLKNARPEKSASPGKTLITDLDRKIGLRLRSTRLHHGLTQQEVARALDISFQQVQKYENGQNRLPIGAYAALRRLMSLDLSDMLDIGGPPARIRWADEWPACDGAEELSVAFLAMQPNHRRLLISLAREFQRMAPLEKQSAGLTREAGVVDAKNKFRTATTARTA